MDSLTQFVLGAAVSTACLGSKIGPRRAALIGGALGTLPDLDVLIPFADPVDTFVYHRGWTHSLFVHAIAAPLIGEAMVRGFKALREHRWLTYGAVYLILATHAMIDAITVYGTRIFWPFYPDPVGVGSVFIIDPLYTLPLLGVVIWALFKRQWTRPLKRGVAAALILSTAYMGLSMVLQQRMEVRAAKVFSEAGIEPDRVFAIAAPFNTVLWKVIGLEDDRYHNVYLSFLDGEDAPTIYSHPRHPELTACLDDSPARDKLVWFSRGFYRADLVEGKVVLSDLRMGLTPGYAFRFAVAQSGQDGFDPIVPERDYSHRRSTEGDLAWLQARMAGMPAVRAAEAQLETAEALPGLADASTCGRG
ncbi:hydrolase [Roseibium aquae]|uniref:Hydrolase n=1 Tax=Roseibium aquae TaxID=1323746 RepID=A0A916WXF2_9HYPH|nr:metal-dependent hydrolase [Roseibium aquae]GGB41401.1 hydrolase [Roseibium aquae]